MADANAGWMSLLISDLGNERIENRAAERSALSPCCHFASRETTTTTSLSSDKRWVDEDV